ncbi:MAG: DUF4255 domain-containing protein [Prolixibacteraceae bacterium]|nr:DUF4255 domain-containing protein [Prolixibacteraceae bacterium]
MINLAVEFIDEIVNEHIKVKFDLNENKLVFSNLVNQDGSLSLKENNKIVASLVSVQEERMNKSSSMKLGQGKFNEQGVFKPPMYINLYILFSVYFEPQLYNEGLKFLSIIISYFQSNNVFTPETYQELDPAIEKLIFEMENMSLQEQNNLWASLGCKYLPSVLFKVRMLTISEDVVIKLGERIKERST